MFFGAYLDALAGPALVLFAVWYHRRERRKRDRQ